MSENPETAIEECLSYFPDNTAFDDQSDDEEKPDDNEENNAEPTVESNEGVST